MKRRREYIRCISEGDKNPFEIKGLCGKNKIPFSLKDLMIAELVIIQEQGIVPCPECLKIARKEFWEKECERRNDEEFPFWRKNK